MCILKKQKLLQIDCAKNQAEENLPKMSMVGGTRRLRHFVFLYFMGGHKTDSLDGAAYFLAYRDLYSVFTSRERLFSFFTLLCRVYKENCDLNIA